MIFGGKSTLKNIDGWQKGLEGMLKGTVSKMSINEIARGLGGVASMRIGATIFLGAINSLSDWVFYKGVGYKGV